MRQGDQFDLRLSQRALDGGVHRIASLKVFLTGRPVAHANHHPAIEKVMGTRLGAGGAVSPRHSKNARWVPVMASSRSDSRLIQRLVSTKRLVSELTMLSPTACLYGHRDAFAVVTRQDGRGQGHLFDHAAGTAHDDRVSYYERARQYD
jgi:hypothetical protein